MSKILDYGNFLSKINESIDSDDERLLKKIDYTLLKPEATEEQIIELCEKADILGVKSVCVLPKMVKVAAEALEESDVLVCTVISFPEGTNSPEEKLAETKRCIADGADECDMVLNYPLLKNLFENKNDFSSDSSTDDDIFNHLVNEVEILVNECHNHTNKDNEPITLKVIVESGLLSDEETEEATHICLNAGADFIKTSTGMIPSSLGNNIGAELNKVQIMKRIIQEEGSDLKIKASGGIRTMNDLQKFDPLVDRFGVGYAAVDSIFGTITERGDEKSISDGY